MADKYVSRSDAIAARMLGNEMMVMSASDSTFFTLDDVATVIWQAADGRTSLSEIVTKICEQYDVQPGQARTDAEELVNELSRHGLLLISETPVTNLPKQ